MNLLFKILAAAFLTASLTLFFFVFRTLRKNLEKKLKDIEAPLLLLIRLIILAITLLAASCLGMYLTK